jgi:hypothetical protein
VEATCGLLKSIIIKLLIVSVCVAYTIVKFVGHGGSLTTEVRRVLFDISFNLYHHSLGTPIGGQFSYIY